MCSGDRGPRRYPEPRYLIGRGHAGDDLVDVIDLLVPGSLEDVLTAITRWALRFGAVVISTPHQGPNGPRAICHAEFDYCGIAVTLYAFIPPGASGTSGTER